MGVYGMVSYSVAQRTREIGIRMALGAQDLQVVRLVVHEGFRPIAAGILAGMAGAAAVSRLLAPTPFGPISVDAVSFSGVSLLLASAALPAPLLPARRAAPRE